MATVVITFFLFARFSVYKMDADWIDSQRDQFLSRREKRWSMNSQRLEEIVAELMRPIFTDRRSFDTDLSALLEEYLTEAGLHALDAAEAASPTGEFVLPNFIEIALLLQHSAVIYCRKVDFLYQHVLQVSEFLHNNTQEVADTSAAEETQTPSTSRRKRKASTHAPADFSEITLEPCSSATREVEAPRPPPTLPRMYVELEPRVITPADLPLYDYAAESIGLLSDFQVTWRLQDGLLVDELEGGSSRTDSALRPISLVELQAAIEAAAPASPPPAIRDDSPPPGLSSPLHASTPLPADPAPADTTQSMPPPAKRERKRRNDVKIDDIFNGNIKIVIGKELMRKLREVREFSISDDWISSVVAKRKCHILSERKRLQQEESQAPDEGFAGWSSTEAAQAREAARAVRGEPDSDDDGFFEQSSGGGDVEQAESLRTAVAVAAPAPAPGASPDAVAAAAAEAAAWRAAILARAAASEARGALDVRALGRQVLAALDGAEERPKPFHQLLAEQARHETDVSRLMLASLFLANAGNVEIVPGPALSMQYSLRLVSRDLRRYALATARDQQFLR